MLNIRCFFYKMVVEK